MKKRWLNFAMLFFIFVISCSQSDNIADVQETLDLTIKETWESETPDFFEHKISDFGDIDDQNDGAEKIEVSEDTEFKGAEEEKEVEPECNDFDNDGLCFYEEEELGLDPQNSDSDFDGTPDGKEVEEGTDPKDPSSCNVWHPDIFKGYPRIFPAPEEFETLKEKLKSPEGLYKKFFDKVKNIADWQALTMDEEFNPYTSVHNAKLINFAIFYGIITNNEEYIKKGKEALLSLRTDVDSITLTSKFITKTTIHASEAIIHLLKAFDLLKGFSLFKNEQEEDLIRSKITEYIDNFYKAFYINPTSLMLKLAKNNHAIKAASALALGAVIFNDYKNACLWANQGITDIYYYMFLFQATGDGGFAEGPGYLIYTVSNSHPFFMVYHRWFDGKKLPYKNIFNIRKKDEYMNKEIVNIPDFFSMPLLHKLHNWLFDLTLPNGLVANIEDSNLSKIPAELVGYIEDGGKFLWNWEKVGFQNSTAVDDSDITLFLISKLPQKSKPLGEASKLYEEGGVAILKTGFTSEDSCVIVLGEHGKARKNGLGHEQADGTSFLFYAMNRYQLIDSGYIHWEERKKVAKSENHNMILVDGKGSGDNLTGIGSVGSDAYLSEFFVSDTLRKVKVSSSYEKCDIERTVYLYKKNLLIIDDKITADKSHNYSILFHGNGGGTTERKFEKKDFGGMWFDETSYLYVSSLTPQGLCEFETYDDYHSFHGEEGLHTVLKSKVSAQNVSILSIAYVSKSSEVDINYGTATDYTYFKITDGTKNFFVFQRLTDQKIDVTVSNFNFELKDKISIFEVENTGENSK